MKRKEILYKGIADCHGIESFVLDSEKETSEQILYLRAESNRQRHAIFYKVKIAERKAKSVEIQIKHGNYDVALKLLKAFAISWLFPQGREKMYENSLDLIPNSRLDPWRSAK